MTDDIGKDLRDWPAERRVALVLSVLQGEVSIEEAARSHGLDPAQVEEWRATFLAAGGSALRQRSACEEGPKPGGVVAREEDVGIWLCASPELSLAPVLFMQSVCPGDSPWEASARWNGSGRPPKAFRGSGCAALLLGECGDVCCTAGRLLLLSARATETGPFERETSLADWLLPLRVAGIVMLHDLSHGEGLSHRLFGSSGKPWARTLAWVEAQQLPFAIAAMVYDSRRFSDDEFRRRHGLGPQTPVIVGPPLARRARSKAGPRGGIGEGDLGLFSFLLGRTELCFDPAYAVRVLRALCSRLDLGA